MAVEITTISTFRIVYALATHAEAVANELAEDYELWHISFYLSDGMEKVAMLFVKKAPVAVPFRPGIIGRN
jgi:hypothetical protein